MYALSKAHRVLAAVDLVQGLAVGEVHAHLDRGRRLHDTGRRILAFYLTEMQERGLHQDTGHASVALFAEDRLGLPPRRTRELVAVGRKLLELPAIDEAFCEQRLGWSKVLALVRVATPEHEQAWLERALQRTCRALDLEVKLSKAGAAPRKPGDMKGLPEVRFRMAASLDVLTHRAWDLAKQKLAAELGRPVDDAEAIAVMSQLFLDMEEDGSVPGRNHVPSSLYRIVLRTDAEPGHLLADTEFGPVPIDGACEEGGAGEGDVRGRGDALARVHGDCIRCDGACVHEDADGELRGRDGRTPTALRTRVLARDGQQCRCCGSRRRLMVHHIRYRSRGGRTRARNLITLCVTCHALVHADLLVLQGARAAQVRFLDASGRALHAPGEHVPPAVLLPLARPPRREEDARPTGSVARARPRPAPKPFAVAFAGLVGIDAVLERLDAAARGSRARGRSFPHTLFLGPPGTGKTTLARAVAARCGARLVEVVGPLLQDIHGLRRRLAELGPGDMLFLDEIHAVPRTVLELLYDQMTRVVTTHDANRQDGQTFTVLAATTEDGELPDALRSRFGLRENLAHYEHGALATLVSHVAGKEGITLGSGAASLLAANARGTPREALRLLERVLDAAAARSRCAVDDGMLDDGMLDDGMLDDGMLDDGMLDDGMLDDGMVEAVLAGLGYDRRGLDPAEQRYMDVLRQCRDPVPLGRLARLLGASPLTLRRTIEPYLVSRGLVRVTPRGRIASFVPRLRVARAAT